MTSPVQGGSAGIFGTGTSAIIPESHHGDIECDIAIVGAGVGGATLAWALRERGARVLVLEQGGFLPRERENQSAYAIFMQHRYHNSAPWIEGNDGPEFIPGNYHYVGGSSKLYGATMPRFREHDFGEVPLREGVSPAWPVSYREMEPWYAQAEELYWVHGSGDDPSEPPRSRPFPFPPIPHEPVIERLAESFARQGLHPFHLPQAIDWREGGRCIRCQTCDAYPCPYDAKGDADVCAMRPALKFPDIRLLTGATVTRVEAAQDGRAVTGLEVSRNGENVRVTAASYVVSAGAVNTAALLLRSRTDALPAGLANSSGELGRNYMAHLSTFVVGTRFGREHRLQYQKTLGLNDWYAAGPGTEFPLGNVQGLGKLKGETIKPARRWLPLPVLEYFTRRSIDLFAQSEDLPSAANHVEIDRAGRIHLHWRPTNVPSHVELVRRTARALRRAGYPLVFTQRLGTAATSHQCGTARMGEDPAVSVVDPSCRSHDVRNLWIVDASVFCSSAAVNPALTVAATALRVADGVAA